MKQRSSRHFLFETLPKEGNKREREPTKHTCSILQPPRSFWTSAVQDGPLTSCCTTQNTIPHHAHTPCYHVQLCQVREKLFSLFPCLIDLDCVSSRQELWQRPPPNDRQWGLVAFSVRLLCRLYSFCSRAAFANLRRCETDPRRSSPNPKG